jgi:hypothetical protein
MGKRLLCIKERHFLSGDKVGSYSLLRDLPLYSNAAPMLLGLESLKK